MRPLSLSLALLMLLALPGLVVADDAEQARLEELWKTGSLWQVGDNIPKVEAARKEIVAAGDAGLAFIFTKLNTTDGLEYRCIEAVFKGFGAKALPGLCERMSHEDVKVRRNVAAMLGVIDDKSAAAKMVEHLKKETDLRCRVGHLQTLARWKEPTALDPLIECTRTTQAQEPLAERLKVRIVPLLANYDDEKAISRLIELLDDPAYFIRDAARDALKGSKAGRKWCLELVTGKNEPAEEPSVNAWLAALSVAVLVNKSEDIGTPVMPMAAQWMMENPDAIIRAAAVEAYVVTGPRYAAEVPDGAEPKNWEFEVYKSQLKWLDRWAKSEADPFVLAAIDSGRRKVNQEIAEAARR